MIKLLDQIQTFGGLLHNIIIALCVIGLIFGIVMMLLISIFGDNTKKQKVAAKREEVKKQTARDIKEAFESFQQEEIPLLSDFFVKLLAYCGMLKIGPIMTSFLNVMKVLKASTLERGWRYRLPWYLVIGPEAAGKTSMLNGLSIMKLPGQLGINESVWHIFDCGVAFEVPSKIFFDKDGIFWEFLIRVFAYFRPRRPLDGVILTLPADILNNQSPVITSFAREAVFKISSLQNITNFRVPIYVVITKSDLISGFHDFCSEFSPTSKGQIIGWSSNEKLDSGIQRNWMESALEEIGAGLRRASLFFSRNKKVSPTLKNVIFVKTGIDSVVKDIHDFVSILMKQQDQTLYLCLRGIYFVAMNNDDVNTTPQIQMSALNPENIESKATSSNVISKHYGMYFADDLFQEKIFKEKNLAHPINMSTLHVSKQTWIKRGAAIAFSVTYTVAWYFGGERINNELRSAENILRSATSLMRKINVIEDDIRDRTDQQILKQETRKMLQLISNINKDNLSSLFVPASWFSGIKSKISSVIGLLFDSSATRTVFLDLNLNAKTIGENQPIKKADKTVRRNPFDVSTSDAFTVFKMFVERIVKLERMEVEYNRIRKLDDPEAINTITKEIFQETFDVTNMLHDRPVGSRFTAPQFNLDHFKTQLQNDAVKLFNRFLDDVFNNTIEKIFDKLQEDIERLLYVSQRPNETYSTEEITKLYKKLKTLSRLVESDSFRWLKSHSFTPNDDYTNVIAMVETSKTLGHKVSRSMLDSASRRFYALKDKLNEYATSLTGPLFDEDSLALSEGIANLTKELETISNESFVAPAFKKDFVSTLSADQMLLWDTKIVADAVDIINKFNDFCDNKLKTFRPDFQSVYYEILRKLVYPYVVSTLARAQNFEDFHNGGLVQHNENAVKKQVANLRRILPYLQKLSLFFEDFISRGGKDSGFANLMIEQANNILGLVDSLFSLQSPYSVGKNIFASWDGASSPNFVSGNEATDLRQYLTSQYRRLSFLAKELAAPAIEVLDTPGIAEKVSVFDKKVKWSDILAQVNAFEMNTPGNSISALEEFMASVSASATSQGIQNDPSLQNMANQSGDYFVTQRAKIAKSLLDRASDINLQKAYNAYSQIESFFNQMLAGRFPFGSTSPGDCSLLTAKNFIDLCSTFDVDIVSTLRTAQSKRNIPNEVIAFLEKLPNVINFIQAWVAHSNDTDPNNALVNFAFDMRANIDSEVHGNIISERSLILNGVSQDDENNIISHSGDTVDVEIPFVLNGSGIEIEPSTKNHMVISDSKVTFSYSGEWGILKLIQAHRVNPSVPSSAEGALLEFDVPVTITDTGSQESAKVFMRAKLFIRVPGGAWQAIPIPSFPDKAPQLPPINI